MQHCAEAASVRRKPSTRVEFFAARSNGLCKAAILPSPQTGHVPALLIQAQILPLG